MMKFCIIFILFLLPTQLAFAGAALEARIQAARQQREAYQRAMQQQAVAQQQAAYRQAQQQMVAQRQAALQQQFSAAQQQVAQQAAHYRQQVVNQHSQAVQQAAQQRVQAIQNQQQQALQQAIAYNQVQQSAQQQLIQQAISQQTQNLPDTLMSGFIPEPPVAEVVDMAKIWEDLEITSEVWPMIIDAHPKEITVQRYIDMYQQQGIMIRKPAVHYVQLIDGMAYQNPELLQKPFSELLKIVAVIEYDYDNGIDKDAMARQVLGERNYLTNKQRLGM